MASQSMKDIPPWLQSMNFDPKAPLSSLETAQILMKYTDHRINENNIEERLHTDNKLKSIIDTLGSLARAFRVTTDTHETMISDLSLKINTVSDYLEHIIVSLKAGLHEAFFRIGADIRQIITNISSSFNSRSMNHNIGKLDSYPNDVPSPRPGHAPTSSNVFVQGPVPPVTTVTPPCSPTSAKENILENSFT